MDRSEQEVVGALGDIDFQTGRQRFGCFSKYFFQVTDSLRSIGSCHLVYDTGYCLMAVYRIIEVVGQTSEFNIGNVFQTENFTVLKGFDYDILKFFRLLETAFVADGVLEALIAAFTKLSGSCFDILFGQCTGYIVRNQLVLCHHIRFQPDTHGVVLTEHGSITHTVYTLYFRNKVDVGIVLKEFDVVLVFLIVNGEYHQHGCLSLLRSHTDFGYLGRQQTLSHGNAVLYVNGCHIRVCTLFEVNGNFGGTVIGCTGSHVHHVLHTVDLVFQRRNDRVQHRLGVGTLVSGAYRYRRWCNVRILGDRQRRQTNKSQDYYQDGDYRR